MRVSQNLISQDSEHFHILLSEYKEKHNYETFFDALVAYVNEFQLEPEDIPILLTPTLKEIILQDALKANLMKEKIQHFSTEELFQ